MDRIEDFKDNKIKLKQKLILVLRELLLDLSRHVDVEYIHCFRIVESNLINSFFDFEYINNILLNCFFFPAINIDMESFNKVLVGQYLLDKTKRFVFVKKEHGLCFYVSFHEIQTNTFYFFLFRGHSVLSHDPFFSFEQFCVFNNLRILPVKHSREFLDYEVTDNEIFFYTFQDIIKIFQHTDRVRSISGFSNVLEQNIPLTCDLNLCYFLGNSLSVGGESFDVCCNKSLLHFSQLSIDFTFFKVVQSFVLCSLGISWNFVPLNKFDIYSGFSCDSGSLSWYGSPLQITYKNFLSFKMYVDYAYTKNLNNQLVRGKEVVALFNFALWFDLLFSFKFFSICGYISLYEDSFAVQIYTFMQLKLVNTNVLCIYSKFNVKEMRLYYWIILDRDYSLLTKLQSQDKNFHVISVETSMNCISFSSTKSFIQTNMSYTPLDSELRFSYSDPDMACYYIGIYNYDYSLYTRLYRMVFYPLFYAYEDAFYTIGVCAYDTRFFIEDSYTGNFPTAEILEKTGIDLNVYIWFFTNEALDAKVFRFYPKIVN